MKDDNLLLEAEKALRDWKHDCIGVVNVSSQGCVTHKKAVAHSEDENVYFFIKYAYNEFVHKTIVYYAVKIEEESIPRDRILEFLEC